MKEEFLHYLWKYRLFNSNQLTTTTGEPVQVVHPGHENSDSGPDFTAAKIRIGETLWAGHVELHVRSSQWEQHGHHKDAAYGNVILHVVYEHDREIFDRHCNAIPVLEAKGKFREELLTAYQGLLSSKAWIPCQGIPNAIDREILGLWLNRLLVERLERKSAEVLQYFEYFKNDWDQTLYFLLARNFGFKTNATAFSLLAQRTPLKTLLRCRNNLFAIEALLFGQSGLISEKSQDDYPRSMLQEYNHLKRKYNLESVSPHLWKFARLRPTGFPTIRIAQFASLIYKSQQLFRTLIESDSTDKIRSLLKVETSPYWAYHYIFDKKTPFKPKVLGSDAINNIII
ncbi:MAG TPA: DUF2851 family protein, partial [Bacteroidales bacterium]|nr:DUF2851 family protein [Bacteroidales bacterium]